MNIRQPAPPKARGRSPRADMVEATVEVGGTPRRALVPADTEPLPPPGDKRREVVAKRKDNLEERLARIEEEMGLDNSGGLHVEISRLHIANEIASKFDYLKVTNARPEFAYYWGNWSAAHGIDITAHQVDGWVVVAGDDPECTHCRDELGRRKIGDVILMRIPLDRCLELRQLDRLKRRMKSEGIDGALKEMGERGAKRGVILHDSLTPYQRQRAMAKAQAKQIAGQRMTSMLRTGRVRGLAASR